MDSINDSLLDESRLSEEMAGVTYRWVSTTFCTKRLYTIVLAFVLFSNIRNYLNFMIVLHIQTDKFAGGYNLAF